MKDPYSKYFSIDKIVSNIKKYLPSLDVKKFKKAFKFAEEAHRGQMRKDGVTPYFVHPVRVVEILTNMHADEDILISALLHDVPEDTDHGIDEVKGLFGDDIAFLVDGITKLSKVQYHRDMPARDLESLKKMFLHSSKDPRVILIKLADRLHNMRTLQFVDKPEKRLRISKETLEIYVPIANLLGIQELKSELEDLCFKYIFPAEFDQISGSVLKFNKDHQPLVEEFIGGLKNSLNAESVVAKVFERKKNLYSIYKKICSEGRSLDGIRDRIAVRVVVDKISDCYHVLGLLHALYTPKPTRFKDYIANPKSNGYQSLHTTVFGPEGRLTEVQIRTKDMNMEAEFGIATYFFGVKTGEIGDDKRAWWMSKVMELDEDSSKSGDYIENLKVDILQDRIVVYTPQGRPIDLPKGATAIDFAYGIHSEVGNHAINAEINGSVFPITTTLKTGDVIQVNTDKSVSPEVFWLSFAKTSTAKTNIRLRLRKSTRSNKISAGKKMLQKQFDIDDLGLVSAVNFRKLSLSLKESKIGMFKTMSDLLISIGEGLTMSSHVTRLIGNPYKKALKISIKVVAKNRFGLMKKIADVFYKHSTDMIEFKGWSSYQKKDANYSVTILVDNLASVHDIFSELEQISEVKYVYRISFRRLIPMYLFAVLTGIMWIANPLILRKLSTLDVVTANPILSNGLINIGLLILLGMVLYLNYLMKQCFPFFRNKMIPWIISFIIPVVAMLVLLVELFYFNLSLSWISLLIEMFIIYIYLGMRFKTFRKNL